MENRERDFQICLGLGIKQHEDGPGEGTFNLGQSMRNFVEDGLNCAFQEWLEVSRKQPGFHVCLVSAV